MGGTFFRISLCMSAFLRPGDNIASLGFEDMVLLDSDKFTIFVMTVTGSNTSRLSVYQPGRNWVQSATFGCRILNDFANLFLAYRSKGSHKVHASIAISVYVSLVLLSDSI